MKLGLGGGGAAVALLVAMLAGCVEVRTRGQEDDQPRCEIDAECPSSASICDLATHRCVQCLPERTDACSGTQPICGEELSCRGCSSHDECGSGLCLPEGNCASEADIAFVEAGKAGGVCSKAAPCATLAAGVALRKPYVKVSGSVTEQAELAITTGSVKIFGAAGASVTGRGENLLRVSGTAQVELHELRLFNAAEVGLALVSGTVSLVNCVVQSSGAFGIYATGGTLRVERSTIYHNEMGGIGVVNNAKLFLSRNVIIHNGRAAAGPGNMLGIGGVAITSTAAGGRVEWNTIAFNQANGQTARGGITCNKQTIESVGNVVFHNSELLNGNTMTTLATQAAQDGSSCVTARDKVVATDDANLGFFSVDQPYNFHLQPGSPLIDAAGGNCDGLDIDGQPRPQGGACDFGADEAIP